VSGPAGKLVAACGYEVSALGVAQIYRDFLNVLIIDEQDTALSPEIERLEVRVATAQTIMNNLEDKIRLARRCFHIVRQ
jgi:LPPG:FO 2-phospho-L-lactate transferase